MLKQINSKFNLQCLQRAYSTGAEVDLKAVMAKKIPDYQNMVKKFRKEHGNDKIMEVTVNMMYGGMRGIKSMIYETSDLDPEQGIRFRGFSIPECQEKLPKAKNGNQPLPEAIFWLLLTSDIPNEEQVSFVTKEWNKRSCLPEYVVEMINNFPKELHPMAQVAAALTVCNLDSKFKEAYEKGVSKNQYWEFIYEDAMNLIPRLSIISALVYRNKYKDGILGEFNEKFDFAKNLNAMMGFNREEFDELMRMYLTIHCDHEGGNVSAHTTHLVGSALSDPYLAYAAGLNGLAGPLHGLANQEVLNWLRKVEKELGDNFTEKQLKDFIWKTLKSGQVIPGFGHAVLRRTDPRYTCQRLFAQKYLPEFPLFKLTDQLYRIVPPILKELGKVANPWPNVDAHSGVLLVHYGLTELTFYTVLFGISRAIGCMSALVWSRALGFPIERPKSISTPLLMKSILKSGKTKQSRSFESVSKVL